MGAPRPRLAATAAGIESRSATLPALAMLVIVAMAPIACWATTSELVVHNRTTVPILFISQVRSNVVLACTTTRFRWSGDWKQLDGAQPSPVPSDAARIRIPVVPPPDSVMGEVKVIVSPDGIAPYYINGPTMPPLPPCEGTPPTPKPSRPAQIP